MTEPRMPTYAHPHPPTLYRPVPTQAQYIDCSKHAGAQV